MTVEAKTTKKSFCNKCRRKRNAAKARECYRINAGKEKTRSYSISEERIKDWYGNNDYDKGVIFKNQDDFLRSFVFGK